jgi:glycosyltransferase involved in cell wall biosynthesis
MKIKLSVVIITFNEEKNIERCLLSVNDIADEIIVLDSLSTDKTKEICLRYNVKFFEQKFLGHIEQKNKAMNLATNDYVLSLDADEALSDKLKKQITEIKQNCNYDAFIFNRLNNYCGKWIKHCGWYPDKKLRLWNRKKGQWGGLNPHDKVIMQSSDAKIKYINSDLLHYSYYSIDEHILQSDKFAKIAAQAYFKKGKKSSFITPYYKIIWKFINCYLLKGGFLEGKYGFIICKITSKETFKKYKILNILK